MTIDQIKTAADTNIRQKIAVNSVTRDEIADLIDNLADEQRDRGIYGVDTTAGLAAVSGANYRKVAVGDTGIFEWSSTGTANGTTIFAASGGGVWILKMAIPKGALAALNSIDYASGALTNKPDLTLKADLVGGKVPSAQLPSYVDDVEEYANLAALPGTGEAGKIYITLDNNSTYRWSGSQYVLLVNGGGSNTLDQTLALGNVTNEQIIFDAPTSLLSSDSTFVIRQIIPSEHGTNAAVAKWYEIINETQSGQQGAPTARKNVVWSFGYNIQQDIANEGYMKFGMESNYRPGGGQEWFEWHAPEVMTRDGDINRWYSITGLKDSAQATHLWLGDNYNFQDIQGGSEFFSISPAAINSNVDAFTVTGRTIPGNEITYDLTKANVYLSILSASTNANYINSNNVLNITAGGNINLTPTGGLFTIANSYGTEVAFKSTTIFGSAGFSLRFAANASDAGSAIIQGNGGSKTDYYDMSLNMPNSSGNGASIHFDNRDGVVSPLEFSVKADGGTSVVYVANVGSNGNWHFGPTRTVQPTASAQVEIESTTKGFLPPRMTKAQRDAISSPATGLVIYQTDNTPGLRCYNGTNWMRYTETAD